MLLLASIFFFSCGKPCRKKLEYCDIQTLHPFAQKYFSMYRTGNYWVYETEGSNEQDTLFTKLNDSTNGFNEETCISWKTNSIEIFKDMNLVGSQLILINIGNYRKCTDTYIRFDDWRDASNKVILSSNIVTVNNAQILPELVFDTNSYSDVFHFFSNKREYFFVENIGLVKIIQYEQGDTISQNLINYYIQ
jgi:hypothetical protein